MIALPFVQVPRIRYWGLHPPPQAIQNVIENKLRSIQRGLALQSVSESKDLPNGHDGLMPTSSRSKSLIIQEYTMQAMKEVIRLVDLAILFFWSFVFSLTGCSFALDRVARFTLTR